MKKRALFIIIIAGIIFSVFASDALNGLHSLRIDVYDSKSGSNMLWSRNLGEITFIDGSPSIDPVEIVKSNDFGRDIVFLKLIIDSDEFSGERIAVAMPASLRREHEPMDEMVMGIQIGEPGNDVGIRSDRLVVGAGDPNEKMTVEGAVSIQEQDVPPGASTGFGKIFIDNTDNHLYYIDESGTITDLTVDGNAVQSVSSSANPTGRMDHMRFIPGEATEITESATDDTIYIRYDVTCGGITPCSSAPSMPSAIDGPSLVCSGEPGTSYSVVPVEGAIYYRWSLPTGSHIISGSGTNAIHVILGSIDGTVSVTAVNLCGESSPRTKAVSINRPTSPGSIIGPALVCEGATGMSYSIATVPDATDYNWTLPPGASMSSGAGTPTVTVNFGTLGGDICVRTVNSCGVSDPECLTVTMTRIPSTPGAITGTSDVCPGESGVSFSIATVAEATSYTWTLPTGASVTSGSGTSAIDVTFGSAGGDVCVKANSSCGSSSTRCMSVNMMIVPTISSHPASASVDEGDPASFSISASGDGLSYQWQQSIDSGSSWSNIGSGGTSYSISSASSSMDGYQYRCIVTGTCAPAETSSVAILSVSSELYTFSTHTFTPCGATGRNGPSISQCRSSYSTTWDDTYLNMTENGIQEWTVPENATYTIRIAGAEGGRDGSSGGGDGAIMQANFVLSRGDVLRIAVGQAGQRNDSGYSGSGGGGTFVILDGSPETPLIVAGGGGGDSSDRVGVNASTGTSGTLDSGGLGTAGSGGNGGLPCSTHYYNGSGGAGYSGDGGNTTETTGGTAFTSGAQGGITDAYDGRDGGFGGGGACNCCTVGGGAGGGYSGGAGGEHYNNCSSDSIREGGGGGGSYIAPSGTSTSSSVGNTGDGFVTITKI